MDLWEEIENICSALERIFGWQYFQKQSENLKKQDPDGIGLGRSLIPFSQQSLGYLWLKAKEELIMGQLNGCYYPGYAANRLRALGQELLAGENKFNWKPLLVKLDQDFETGAFLVHWIWRLLEAGYAVEIVGDLTLKLEERLYWEGVNCKDKDWSKVLEMKEAFHSEIWAFNLQAAQLLDFEQEFWRERIFVKLAETPKLEAVILSQGWLSSAAFVRSEKIFCLKEGLKLTLD